VERDYCMKCRREIVTESGQLCPDCAGGLRKMESKTIQGRDKTLCEAARGVLDCILASMGFNKIKVDKVKRQCYSKA